MIPLKRKMILSEWKSSWKGMMIISKWKNDHLENGKMILLEWKDVPLGKERISSRKGKVILSKKKDDPLRKKRKLAQMR
jgi:hypothetical protein